MEQSIENQGFQINNSLAKKNYGKNWGIRVNYEQWTSAKGIFDVFYNEGSHIIAIVHQPVQLNLHTIC